MYIENLQEEREELYKIIMENIQNKRFDRDLKMIIDYFFILDYQLMETRKRKREED